MESHRRNWLRRTSLLVLISMIGVAIAAFGAANRKPLGPDSVAAGAKLFGQYCQTCHGKTGRGDGPTGVALKPRPRNFHNPKEFKSKNDEELYKVISKGGPSLKLSPLMVGWGGTLKEMQIRQLIAFIRTLRDTAEAKAP